jgi:hypothetical protein
MTGEVQKDINKFLYNLSMQDYASANEQLKNLIEKKVNEKFDNAYKIVKNDYMKQINGK